MWLPLLSVVLLTVSQSQSQGQGYGQSPYSRQGQGYGTSQQVEPVEWPTANLNQGVKTGGPSYGGVRNPTPRPSYTNQPTDDVATGEQREPLEPSWDDIVRRLEAMGYTSCTNYYLYVSCYSSSLGRFVNLQVKTTSTPGRQPHLDTRTTTDGYEPNSSPVTNTEFGSPEDRGVQRPTPRTNYNQPSSGVNPGPSPTTWAEHERTLIAVGYTHCTDYGTTIQCWNATRQNYDTLPHYKPASGASNQPSQNPAGDFDGISSTTTDRYYRQTTEQDTYLEEERQPENERPSYLRTTSKRPGQGNYDYAPNSYRPRTTSTTPQSTDYHDEPEYGDTTPQSTTGRNPYIISQGGSDNRPEQPRPGSRQRPATQARPVSGIYPELPEREDAGIYRPQTTTDRYQPGRQGDLSYDRPRQPAPGYGPSQQGGEGRRPGPTSEDTPTYVYREAETTTERYRPSSNQGGSSYDRPAPSSGPGVDRNPGYQQPGPGRRPTHTGPTSDEDIVQESQRPNSEDFVEASTTERHLPAKGQVGQRGSATNTPRQPGYGPGSGGNRNPGQQGGRPPTRPRPTSEEVEEPQSPEAIAKAKVAEATCKFSLDVFKTALKNSPGNVIMSPLSVQTVLAMLQQGAHGRSSQQLEDILYVRPDVSKAGYTAVIKEYQKHPNELTLASKIFVHPDFAVLPQFSKTLLDHFNSGVQPLPRSSPAATSTINNWVREKTKNRITELVKPGDVTTRTQMVLANVIHFKAEWLRTFDPEETRIEKFHTTPNNDIDVFMMQNDGLFKGGRDDQLKAYWLDMLYDSSDRDFSMIAVLPTEPHGLDAVIDRLNVGHLKKMMDSKTTYHVAMKMPRFKLNADTSLKGILLQLGLRDVFDQRSHLEGISRRTPLVVSEIVHSAEIEVTEEGTEAAGASALYGNVLTITPTYERLDFNATQPFLAIIVDNIHKMPLFMTRVSNPGLFAPVEY